MAEQSELIPDAVFRHYKGNEYRIITLARNESDEKPVVVYKALYGAGGIWVRALENFCEMVEVDGVRQDRFKCVG